MVLRVGKRGEYVFNGTITAMYKSGMSERQIADKLGVTRNRLHRHIEDIGIELRPPGSAVGSKRMPRGVCTAIILAYKRGDKVPDIAVRFNRNWRTIYALLKRRGITLDGRTKYHA
jgi:transposase